ncbi:MAG: calcium-binding protein [bacterium]
MQRHGVKSTRKGKRGVTRRSKRRLDMLVAEAIVDCYNESEQVTGLYSMIEEHLGLPFKTTVLGVPVTVRRVEMTQREEIVAVCHRAGVRQTAPILDLPLPSLRPDGAEWIDAYRHWLGAR